MENPYNAVLAFQKANGDVDFSGLWHALGVTQRFPTHRGPYYIDAFGIRDLPEGQKGCLVRIGSQDKDSWEYLVFMQDKRSWKCVGVVDKMSQAYREPRHRFEAIGNMGVWWVIRVVSVHGTGVFEESEEWYDVLQNPIRRVLSYPVAGRSAFAAVGALFEYEAHSVEMDCCPTVCVSYRLSWSLPVENRPEIQNVISQVTGRVAFSIDSIRNFRLDDEQSDKSLLSFCRDWQRGKSQ